MRLYTTWPKQRKFTPIDPVTERLQYNKAVVLYPNEPTDVPAELAKVLIKQNGDLISTKPYDELPSNEKYDRTPPGFDDSFADEIHDNSSPLPLEAVTDGSLSSKEVKKAKKNSVSLSESIPEVSLKVDSREKIMREIMDKGGVEALNGKECIEYGKKLGIEIGIRNKLPERRKLLDEGLQKAWNEINPVEVYPELPE